MRDAFTDIIQRRYDEMWKIGNASREIYDKLLDAYVEVFGHKYYYDDVVNVHGPVIDQRIEIVKNIVERFETKSKRKLL